MKSILQLLLVISSQFFSYSIVVAQQEPLYSQYMFNGPIINPASSSLDEFPSLTVVGRNQWVDIDQAPRTASLSFHYPLKTGTSLGVMAYSDKVAVIGENNIAFNIAQKVHLSSESYLALGLRAGISFYKENNTSLNTDDPVFQYNRRYRRSDLGFGLAYFNKRLFVGLSSPNFRKLNTGSDKAYQLTTQMHWFLQSAYLFDLNEDLKLKPSVLVKYTEGAPWQVDLNTNLLIREILWLGASWRSSNAVVGIIQIQLTRSLQIGYSYDIELNKYVRESNKGSHEIMLNYRFPTNDQRVVSPRHFF